MGLGLGLGLLLGPFGLPFAIAADMSQSEKREAILAELRKHCEGDLALTSGLVAGATGFSPQSGDVVAKLEVLKDLKTKGLLSEDEYTARRIQLVDSAVGGATASSTARAAVVRNEPAVGFRLVLSDYEPLSGVLNSESTILVTSVSAQLLEFNDGQFLIRRQDQTIAKGWPGIAGIYGFSIAGLTPGSQLTARFATSNAAAEIVPVTLRVVGIEQLSKAGATIQVAKADVAGYSSRDLPYGTPGSHRGAPMKGTVFIDLATGLVIEGEVKSINGLYAFRREMQRIARPSNPG